MAVAMRLAGLVIAVFALPALAQSAAKLNSRGFDLYKQQRYAEAIDAFRAAIEKDEKHALAHYNLAATLALMRTKGLVCEHDAYRSVILQELQRAIQLDPRRRTRALEDADFQSVHDTLGWQKVKGLTVPKDAAAILTAVHWYGPSPGAYGPTHQLRFRADGTLTGSRLDLESDDVRHVPLSGTWAVKGREVTVTYGAGKDARSVRYRFEDDGRLVPADGTGEPLTDDPDDCSA